MKKIILFAVIFIIFMNLTFGKKVDESTAKTIATNFLTNRPEIPNSSPSLSLNLIYTATSDPYFSSKTVQQNIFYYVFNVNSDHGFIIVSADDNIKPILGYSFEGRYNPEDLPPHVTSWLVNYQEQIQQIILTGINASQTIRSEWESLLSGSGSNLGKASNSVSPLLTTMWGQSDPYNGRCPYDNQCGKRTLTGCVATAMAQVMKFWNYPATGTGYHSYTSSGYGTQSASFGSTTYDWSSMSNSITTSNNAVATLMYHCGVSVDMNYGCESSGAYVISETSPITHCTQYALKTYFGYSGELMYGLQREKYGDEQWKSFLTGEIDAGRPVIYTGRGIDGGHCFVCDGYSSSDYFHFNWGWNGQFDGYFTIDALYPGDGWGYNNKQEAIVGLQPPDNYLPVKLGFCDYLTVSPSMIGYNRPFTVLTNLRNLGSNEFSGLVCAAVFTINGDFINYVESPQECSLPGGNSFYYGLSFSTYGMPELYYGNYLIAVFYLPDGGDSWIQVPDSPPYYNPVTFNVSEVGIEENKEHEMVRVFPNPASEQINIDFSSFQGEIERIQIINNQGRMVTELKPDSNSSPLKLDVTKLAAGLYNIQILTSYDKISRKLIISR